jgi:cytochrome c553
MNAPPIAGASDWYLLAQLKKFKAGVRGANPADVTGGTMRPMAMTLADEQAMKNVIAHISTLNR